MHGVLQAIPLSRDSTLLLTTYGGQHYYPEHAGVFGVILADPFPPERVKDVFFNRVVGDYFNTCHF
jgi:hypothetical protein